MAFPTSPTEGQIYNRYMFSSGRWVLRLPSASPISGDTDLGHLYLLSGAHKNDQLVHVQLSPVNGTVYPSPSLADRVPAGAKAVLIRWWVQKAIPAEANSWYWAGFGASDDANLTMKTSSTVCVGSEFTGGGTYHHEVITVPLSSESKFSVYFNGTGTFGSFNYNVLGYYL